MAYGETTANGAPSAGTAASSQEGIAERKLGGIFWWLILGCLIMIDTASVILSLVVEGIGVGVSMTVVGIVIGIPLALLGWAGGIFLTANALLLSIIYFLQNKVPLLQARKLATIGTSALIEAVPILSALPTASLSFIVVTLFENMKRGKGALGGITGTIVQKTIGKTPVGKALGTVATKMAGGSAAGGFAAAAIKQKNADAFENFAKAPSVKEMAAPATRLGSEKNIGVQRTIGQTPQRTATANNGDRSREGRQAIRDARESGSRAPTTDDWRRDKRVDDALKLRNERVEAAKHLGKTPEEAQRLAIEFERRDDARKRGAR